MSLPPASATTQPIQSHSGYMTPEILLPAYRSASTRILLFDYDGTLTPIIATPSLATLPPLAATLLASLANHPQNTVWVVSGRDRAFLDLHVGHLSPSLGLCAEHGAFLRPPRSTAWQDLSVGEDLSWKPVIERLFEETARDLEGSGVERKQAAVVWHYRQARDMELARDRARRVAVDLKALAARREWVIAVVEGKCVVEVRPGRLGKGGIVERLLGEMVVGDEAVFVMAVGDDTTDEDMFCALNRSSVSEASRFSVKVGGPLADSAAEWYLESPGEVLKCIAWLVGSEAVSHIGTEDSSVQ